MSRIWRMLELDALKLEDRLNQATGIVAMHRENPDVSRRALLNLLDLLTGFAWDFQLAAQQMEARRPDAVQAERAMRYTLDRLTREVEQWVEIWNGSGVAR